MQIYQYNEWHQFLLSITDNHEESWKIYYYESLWVKNYQYNFYELSEIFSVCTAHDEYDFLILQIFCVLLHWQHCYFFENLTKSFSAFEYDVQFIWQAENNTQKSQNLFRVFVHYSTRLTSWWFWHDFFEETNCCFIRFIIFKNLERF